MIVLNGDVPLITPETIRGLAEAHGERGRRRDDGDRRARRPARLRPRRAGADGTVERVVETKSPGDATELELHIREVNTGIFAFEGGALLAGARARSASDNAQGELYLPDVLPILRSARAHRARLRDRRSERDARHQRSRRSSPRSRADAQRRIHERHMLAGVTIVDPSATVIDAEVEIGQDTVIAPFTSLHGATRSAPRSTIGPALDA